MLAAFEEGDKESCWPWLGSALKTSIGLYGRMSINGKSNMAHRLVYSYYRGAIPEGLDLDHLCRNTICVNPWHLEPVTRAENIRRGHIARRPKVCPAGHSLEGTNRVERKRRWVCRICWDEQIRAARIARRITHCKRGHSLAEGNYYITNGGKSRRCKMCQSICVKAWRQRKQVA